MAKIEGGCDFDWNVPMFHQVENTSSPISNWDFHIHYKRVVEDRVGWPNYRWMPDGHISTLQVRCSNLLGM